MWGNLSIVATQFANKDQSKHLTHMLCFLIPYYKLYQESMFSYVFTLKYMYHFGMTLEKFNLKCKTYNF